MHAVVIVAAGRGTRCGPDRDKLFLELGGHPVIARTWSRFDRHSAVGEIVLVIRPGLEEAFEQIGKQISALKPYRFVPGGTERQDSVWNGLCAVSNPAGLVAIHDGARPCVNDRLITECFRMADLHGAAVAAQPVTDTIKESADGYTVHRHLDRSRLWAVQTPQTFRVDLIRRALLEVRQRRVAVTDDTAACELIGQPVHLVASHYPNPKVTVPEDLPYLEFLIRSQELEAAATSAPELRSPADQAPA